MNYPVKTCTIQCGEYRKLWGYQLTEYDCCPSAVKTPLSISQFHLYLIRKFIKVTSKACHYILPTQGTSINFTASIHNLQRSLSLHENMLTQNSDHQKITYLSNPTFPLVVEPSGRHKTGADDFSKCLRILATSTCLPCPIPNCFIPSAQQNGAGSFHTLDCKTHMPALL